MPNTLICNHALIESAREIYSASRLISPDLDRSERLNRVHAALSSLVPEQPDGWTALAVAIISEQAA